MTGLVSSKQLFGLLCVVVLLAGCDSAVGRRVSAYERAGDRDGARAYLEQVVRSTPNHAEAQFLLGERYLEAGQYAEGKQALEASRQASAQFVEHIDFLLERYTRVEFQQGVDRLADKQPDAAIGHFAAVLVLAPEDGAAYRGLGQAHVMAGRVAEAEEAYRNAVALDATDLEALNNLGELAFRQGAYDQAIAYARQVLDAYPGHVQSLKRLAYAHLRRGELAEAEQAFAELQSTRAAGQVRPDYALVLFNQGKYARALPVLRQVAGDEDPALTRALAETYVALDQHQAAIRAFRQLLEQAPDDRDALQSLAALHTILGQTEQAQAYRERFYDLEPASP